MKLWRDLDKEEIIRAGDRELFVNDFGQLVSSTFNEAHEEVQNRDTQVTACLLKSVIQRPVEFPDNAISPVEQVKTVPQDENELWKDVYKDVFLRYEEKRNTINDSANYASNAASVAVEHFKKFKKGDSQ